MNELAWICFIFHGRSSLGQWVATFWHLFDTSVFNMGPPLRMIELIARDLFEFSMQPI